MLITFVFCFDQGGRLLFGDATRCTAPTVSAIGRTISTKLRPSGVRLRPLSSDKQVTIMETFQV